VFLTQVVKRNNGEYHNLPISVGRDLITLQLVVQLMLVPILATIQSICFGKHNYKFRVLCHTTSANISTAMLRLSGNKKRDLFKMLTKNKNKKKMERESS